MAAYSITYTGWPGDSAAERSFNQRRLSPVANQLTTVVGKRMMDEAKIGGITPDMLSLSGRCEDWPPMILLPTWRLA